MRKIRKGEKGKVKLKKIKKLKMFKEVDYFYCILYVSFCIENVV